MFDTFFTYITTHFPLVGAAVILIAATWYTANVAGHWKQRIKQTETDCQKIDGHILPQIANLTQSSNSLNKSVTSLIVYLKAKDNQMDASLFQSYSPIKLTDLGQRLLATIGGKAYVDKNEVRLIAEMDKIGVKTALDSQTIAPIVISSASEGADFKAIKDYIFNTPTYKENRGTEKELEVLLDMNTVSMIMGIYLRDKYLSKHPELNPEDIPSVNKA